MSRLVIDKKLDINYNLDYLVIVPKNIDFFDAFLYSFENVLAFDNTVEDLEFLIKFLKKNTISQLIFVNYYAEYEEIINTLVEEHNIKFIFTKELGELSDSMVLNELNCICNMYDNGIIDNIGFLDPYLCCTMRNTRKDISNIILDIGEREDKKEITSSGEKAIGLLNSGLSNYSSFYNELSSFVFLPEYKAKIEKPAKVVLDFAEEYGVDIIKVLNFDELVGGNECNYYINFAGTNPLVFIKSMDMGVPCIIGNNGFLNKYTTLKKYLVMDSDDDVNEIAERFKKCINNKNTILEEYRKFRNNYKKESVDSIESFLGKKNFSQEDNKYEKILTVVVPVYNTEKYIARCLDSIIQARVPNMEILIINDGSTDDSEKIIKKYISEYPDLIRYIRQKNGGLGHVRNVGLAKAKGKYLASVDSDDTIEPDFLKDAMPYINKNVDVIVYDWMSISVGGSFETPALDWVFRKRKIIEGLLYTTIMPSTCNKIIKAKLFYENKVCYLEQKYEDLSVNPIVLLKAKTLKYIRKPYYNYYLSENSLMRSKIDPKEMVDAINYLDSGLKKNCIETIDVDEFKYYTYSWRIEEYILNPLCDMSGKKLSNAISYIYENMYNLVVKIFNSDYYIKMLDGLKSEDLREFILRRNDAFKDKRLEDFLKNNKFTKKITASTIYYGDK